MYTTIGVYKIQIFENESLITCNNCESDQHRECKNYTNSNVSRQRAPVNLPSNDAVEFQNSDIEFPKIGRAVSNPEINKAGKAKEIYDDIAPCVQLEETENEVLNKNSAKVTNTTVVPIVSTPPGNNKSDSSVSENLGQQVQERGKEKKTVPIVFPSALVLVSAQEVSSVAIQEIAVSEASEVNFTSSLVNVVSSVVEDKHSEATASCSFPRCDTSPKETECPTAVSGFSSFVQKLWILFPVCLCKPLVWKKNTHTQTQSPFTNLANLFGRSELAKSKYKTGVI